MVSSEHPFGANVFFFPLSRLFPRLSLAGLSNFSVLVA